MTLRAGVTVRAEGLDSFDPLSSQRLRQPRKSDGGESLVANPSGTHLLRPGCLRQSLRSRQLAHRNWLKNIVHALFYRGRAYSTCARSVNNDCFLPRAVVVDYDLRICAAMYRRELGVNNCAYFGLGTI
jgi:hypothetical protein